MTIGEKAEAMRRKYAAKRTARQDYLYKRMMATKAKREADRARAKSPEIVQRRRVHNDLPAATLDRMELLAYRIARRKWHVRVPRLASIAVTHLQPK